MGRDDPLINGLFNCSKSRFKPWGAATHRRDLPRSMNEPHLKMRGFGFFGRESDCMGLV
jgi:hypothetical protein